MLEKSGRIECVRAAGLGRVGSVLRGEIGSRTIFKDELSEYFLPDLVSIYQ